MRLLPVTLLSVQRWLGRLLHMCYERRVVRTDCAPLFRFNADPIVCNLSVSCLLIWILVVLRRLAAHYSFYSTSLFHQSQNTIQVFFPLLRLSILVLVVSSLLLLFSFSLYVSRCLAILLLYSFPLLCSSSSFF